MKKEKELNDVSRVLGRIEELLDNIEKGLDKDGVYRKELKELCNKLTKFKWFWVYIKLQAIVEGVRWLDLWT